MLPLKNLARKELRSRHQEIYWGEMTVYQWIGSFRCQAITWVDDHFFSIERTDLKL